MDATHLENERDVIDDFNAVCDRLKIVERRSHWLTVLLAVSTLGGAALAWMARRQCPPPTVEKLRRNGVI